MYKIINKKKLLATLAVDIAGNIVFSPKLLFKRRGEIRPGEVMNILIIRTAYIGDVIMTLPVLKPLRERFPNARITFLTGIKSAEVISNNPYVDEVLTYDAFWFYGKKGKKVMPEYLHFLKHLRAKMYDLVIEARADIRDILMLVYPSRSRYKVSYNVGGGGYLLTHTVPYRELKHKVEYHLDMARYLGCNDGPVEWSIYLTPVEEKKAGDILGKLGVPSDRPLVAMHPGARLQLKCWSAKGFAVVADRLIEESGANIIFTGSPDEVDLVKRIEKIMRNRPVVLAGETTIREMASILKKCDLFICNDSSPLHIASAMKTPTVAIFGPSKSRETGPYGNTHRVVEKDFPCRYDCDESTCRHTMHNECMTAIGPDDVINAAMEIMQDRTVAVDHQ
ncbi:MAG: glycosyltransferase family 9 protein [Nitrospirae bacterium]|nr:glycosyltransferase family 9 protein [Nitrospirota bacterium]